MAAYARSWTKRSKTQSADERWQIEEDVQKRVYIPDFRLSPATVLRLERLSAAAGVSRSAWLERKVRTALVVGISLDKTTSQGKKRKHLGGPGWKKRGWKRYKKLVMHPSLLSILRSIKEDQGVSWSVLLEAILSGVCQSHPPF